MMNKITPKGDTGNHLRKIHFIQQTAKECGIIRIPVIFSKTMGLFSGGTLTRYLGPAEESSVTEKKWEGSVLFGLFYMTGNKP